MKRDGREEAFDARKLAAAMHRAMRRAGGGLHEARQLALAIGVFLSSRGCGQVTSAAVFEMSVKVLHRIGRSAAADALEAHRAWRGRRRRRLRVRHDAGTVTVWDKSWVCEQACRTWGLSRAAGRIIAGQIEMAALGAGRAELSRREVRELVNEHVAAFGLADAVPLAAAARVR
jgi:hypothetical protein